MTKVLVAGATGALGFHVVKILKEKDFYVRALCRDEKDAQKVNKIADEIFIGDAGDEKSLNGICQNIDIVFSSLGKSVSIFSSDPETFNDIDFLANRNILNEAIASNVKRFVYTSIFGSTEFKGLKMAMAHGKFEELLKSAGLSYTIIRPVAMFAGLKDVLNQAKQGLLITVGAGDKKINPIHHKDLARVIVENIENGPENIDAGGPEEFTRDEIAKLAIKAVGKNSNIHVPEWMVNMSLPMVEFIDKNLFDKLSFFNKVLTTDIIAPKYGCLRLEDYFMKKTEKI